jgi:hypothetical protein
VRTGDHARFASRDPGEQSLLGLIHSHTHLDLTTFAIFTTGICMDRILFIHAHEVALETKNGQID